MKHEEQNSMSGLKLKMAIRKDGLKPGETGFKSGAKPRRESCKEELKPGRTGCKNGTKPRVTALVTARESMVMARARARATRQQ